MTAKYTKQEVAYTDKGHKDSHCSICRHWQGGGRCEIVNGKVVAGGWCEHFKPARRRRAA